MVYNTYVKKLKLDLEINYFDTNMNLLNVTNATIKDYEINIDNKIKSITNLIKDSSLLCNISFTHLNIDNVKYIIDVIMDNGGEV